jgi:hypothetical protein
MLAIIMDRNAPFAIVVVAHERVLDVDPRTPFLVDHWLPLSRLLKSILAKLQVERRAEAVRVATLRRLLRQSGSL